MSVHHGIIGSVEPQSGIATLLKFLDLLTIELCYEERHLLTRHSPQR